MSLLFKFVCGFASLGIILSLFFSLMGGGRFSSTVLTVFFLGIVSGVLGAGTYKVLEKNVPESLGFFQKLFTVSSSAQTFGRGTAEKGAVGEKITTEKIQNISNPAEEASMDSFPDIGKNAKPAAFTKSTLTERVPVAGAAGEGTDKKNYGTHILLDNIKIKNEPKLMAEAVRTMLAKDQSGGTSEWQ